MSASQGVVRNKKCWEYGTATRGSMPFTWLESNKKIVLGEVQGLKQRGAVNQTAFM
jgi:hypothetical protein